MPRVRLVHWKAAEAASLLDAIRGAGYNADYEERPDYHISQAIRAQCPAAVVIDLSRLPSHGREVATFLRGSKATRHIPIVFVNGAAEKVEAIRALLPDAVYTTTARVGQAIRRAIAKAPAAPVVPAQMMERYKARTAAQKLGIKQGARVALIDPPRDYMRVLGELPPEAAVEERLEAACDVTLWFVRDPAEFQSALPRMRPRAAASKLWILWQKQAARGGGAISQQLIRESAIAMGLVDYKVCSVNETWSGLAFALSARTARSPARSPAGKPRRSPPRRA
jgi:CheY-like chemotaxis protein